MRVRPSQPLRPLPTGGIAGNGFKTLAEGAKVEFEPTEGPKGLQATNVVQIDA